MLVDYGLNRGVEQSGFDVLNETLALWDVKGFPTMRASVIWKDRGYDGYFGFIQIVTYRYAKGRSPAPFIDTFPSMKPADSPFAVFGCPPQLFDAPAWEKRQAGVFDAECYLCSPGLMDRDRPVSCLTGFSWGFEIFEPGGAPRALPLAQLMPKDWARRRPLLRERYPKWRF